MSLPVIEIAKRFSDLRLEQHHAQERLSDATSKMRSAEAEVNRLKPIVAKLLERNTPNKPIIRVAKKKLNDASENHIEQCRLWGEAFTHANSVSRQLSLVQRELESLNQRKD